MSRQAWISVGFGFITCGAVGAFGVNPFIAVAVGIVAMLALAWWFTARETPRHRTITPAQVNDDDPIMRAIVAEAWNTGKPVSAEVFEDGHAEITVHDDE